MVNVTQGIEGNDLLWHLDLLGVSDLDEDFYFVPLVNHYNTHGPKWAQEVTETASKYRVVVLYDLLHTGDYENTQYKIFVENFQHPNKVYLTVNQCPNLQIDGVKVVQWDFMWNRYKAYYTEPVPNILPLHHYQAFQYNQITLDVAKQRKRKFLSPMGREYGPRTQLYEIVKQYDGYVSNRSKGITFEDTPVTGIFVPISNEIYLDSYFSIYVESNSSNAELIHLTEKTFEPLTKGHFILPITNPGSIARIQCLGFKLPDFIDYSFDLELNPELRFEMVIKEFYRLLDLDLKALSKDNQELLQHNRDCLNTIAYDSRLLEIFNV